MDNERDLMGALLRMQEKALDAQERHERQRQKTSRGLQFVIRGVTVRRMLLSGADRSLERWKASMGQVEQVGYRLDFAAAEAQVEAFVAGLKLAASAIVDDAHRFELGMEEVRYLASIERGEGAGVFLPPGAVLPPRGPFLQPLPRVPMKADDTFGDRDRDGACDLEGAAAVLPKSAHPFSHAVHADESAKGAAAMASAMHKGSVRTTSVKGKSLRSKKKK